MKKRPKLKNKEELKSFSNGGKLMAASPGLLKTAGGVGLAVLGSGMTVASGGALTPIGASMVASGIGMAAGGAGDTIKGVQGYNNEMNQNSQDKETAQMIIQNDLLNKQKASNPYVEGAPASVFKNGGIQNIYNPNAEVEKQEVIRMPNGGTEQVNGPSHAQGGVPVNIPNGTQIYSDRLKDKTTGKTFAKMAEKYKVNKEEKVINDSNASSLAKNTAKLAMQLKQNKLSEIFKNQEDLKASKYQASISRAAKKYGVNHQMFMNGGQYGVPKYYNGGYSTPEGTFNDKGEKIAGPYGEPLNDSSLLIDGINKTSKDVSTPLVTNDRFGNPDNMFKSEQRISPSLYDPNKFINKPVTGKPFDITSGTKQTPITSDKPLPDTSYEDRDKFTDWGSVIGAGAQLGADAIRMAKSLKKPQTYKPTLYKPESYDPSQALREANQANRVMREQAKIYSGGNANAYLSSLSALQAQHVGNKTAVRSQYDQMNVGARNQAAQINSQVLTQRAKDVQEDWSVRDNAIADSASKMASTIGNVAKDYNRGKMDEKMLKSTDGKYFRFNKNTGEYEEIRTKK